MATILIPKPNNSMALAFYLLFEAGLKGMTIYDAVLSDRFFKFNTRVSDLIIKHKVNIHKQTEVSDKKDRWGNEIESTRYALYANDLEVNLEIYNKINGEPKETTALDYVSELTAKTAKKKRSSIPTAFQIDLKL